jgi:hypothetical protein
MHIKVGQFFLKKKYLLKNLEKIENCVSIDFDIKKY